MANGPHTRETDPWHLDVLLQRLDGPLQQLAVQYHTHPHAPALYENLTEAHQILEAVRTRIPSPPRMSRRVIGHAHFTAKKP